MEKKQKGEQFSIIDSAVIPQKPVSPNMKRLLLLCILAGLGVGFVLIYVLEFIDSSFRGPEDFESDLGIPVLVSVPKIYHRKDVWWHGVNRALTAVSLFIALCLAVVFAVLVFNGVEKTLDVFRPYVALLG